MSTLASSRTSKGSELHNHRFLRRQQSLFTYLTLLAASSILTVVQPAPPPSTPPSAPVPNGPFQPLAQAPLEPAAPTLPITSTSRLATTTTAALQPTRITTSATNVQSTSTATTHSIITVSSTAPLPTATTKTTVSFSENIITVDRPTSSSGRATQSSGTSPSETPNGTLSPENSKSLSLMLIVSLVVVFVVLAGMGLVVCCLFHRRSAKRRRLFGKNNGNSNSSSNGIDDMLASAAAAKRRDSHNGSGLNSSGIAPGAENGPDLDVTRALQEMTEQHQNVLLSRRSSNLSLGSGQHSGSRVLSPTLAPAPYAHTSWTSSGPMEHFDSGREFRNSQYDEFYGRPASGLRQPFYPGAGDPNYSSNEQLVPSYSHRHQSWTNGTPSSSSDLNAVSRRSSLSPAFYPCSEPISPSMSQLPSVGGLYVPEGGDNQVYAMMRPKSMSMLPTGDLMDGSPAHPQSAMMNIRPQSAMASTLAIPPSITTRPRSVMTSSPGIYPAYSRQQHQGQMYQYPAQSQVPHPYYYQQPHQQQYRYYPNSQETQLQYSVVSPGHADAGQIAEDDNVQAIAAAADVQDTGLMTGSSSEANEGTHDDAEANKKRRSSLLERKNTASNTPASSG
ncbi:hypothetical protein BC939DRAFT_502868 [Gamsiella multidivaricata]|uniref:uncharacterized protein n=1 Tax=Gamsiella multidivaricata TaxID=101098 RepID=UPI0022206A3B|nr:uncharacterized protein BC939DRAFT_502868 [Gamsiella multidivaricata]KAG0369957.1 hypothetical protein BGZ54_008260 [Gamsiella multidivaricata]KAI7824057.1 hypothetical protein BC939DRAFT_502868 [Gamsiella multidivaricata]